MQAPIQTQREYYKRLFPFEQVFRFLHFPLNYLPAELKIDLMVTSYTGEKREMVQRWIFPTLETFRELLQSPKLIRVDMGGCWSMQLDRSGLISSPLEILSRPVTIDYDVDFGARSGVCGCGSEKKCCETCWDKFCIPKLEKLEIILSVLGVEYFYCYSGGRGFHVWVTDPRWALWSSQTREEFLHTLSTVALGITDEEQGEADRIPAEAPPPPLPPLFHSDLDERITTSMDHFLRLPFSVHQDTHNVVFPFRGAKPFQEVCHSSSSITKDVILTGLEVFTFALQPNGVLPTKKTD